MAELTVKSNGDAPAVQEAFVENAVIPAVDIFEGIEELIVLADMPGLKKEAITVSTEKGILTIKGERANEIDRDYTWREFEPANYYRQFRLGEKIDQTRINAEYKQGILTIKLPMAEEVRPRQIDVKVK